MKLKKIDRLLATSFLPPFVVTFFIALFVLVMQTLWLYIDDIAGKGVGFFLIVELVAYMSVSMIPMALPVAVLISSVMVLGNLAERYELSSIKSAGVSLWRVMRPMMAVSVLIGIFSFFCSNNFIPVSNLKFKARLHDIKNQKPALSMEESLFNADFQGYAIRIGDKMEDNQTIKDVLLFDNRETGKGQMSMVSADSGLMFGSADGKYFVMHLYEGHQISEPKPTNTKGKRNYPMMRATYKEWTKVFDLDEFELDRTDENLFKSHHSMLSNRQLLIAVDSIDKKVEERFERFNEQTNRHFHFWQKAAIEKNKKKRKLVDEKRKKENAERRKRLEKERKANQKDKPKKTQNQVKKSRTNKTPTKPTKPKSSKTSSTAKKAPGKNKNKKPSQVPDKVPLVQNIDKPVSSYSSIAETFNEIKKQEIITKASSTVRTILDQSKSNVKSLRRTLESRVKHIFEFHTKFSMATACFIFLFVGAPMGAIVRKGGFGWPLLISIVFFMLFIIISIFSKNIAERFVIHAVLAGWMNCLIIFPMGLLLTYWAMRDMGWTQVVDFFKIKWPSKWSKKAAIVSEKEN